MNKNEIQVLTSYVKGMIADNKEPEKKVIIALCDELERITYLKPIGYMSVTGIENIYDCGNATVHEESDDKRNIPLYIQY